MEVLKHFKNGFGFKKTKTQKIMDVLSFILNSEKDSFSESELKTMFPREYDEIKKILQSYSFLSPLQMLGSDGVNYVYRVVDHGLLLSEIQKLNELDGERRHRSSDKVIKLASVAISLYLLFFTAMQFIETLQSGSFEKKIAQMNLELISLNTKSSLEIKRIHLISTTLDSEKNSSIALAEICIVNRGGIDSGPILLNLSGLNIPNELVDFSSVPSKKYVCENISISLRNLTDRASINGSILNCLTC